LEEELDKDALCHHFFFNFYSKCLNKEALEGFGDLKIGGQVIHSMKYADDFVLLFKEEMVLQCVIGILTEIGRGYGMEMN
jgi:hypothetical protein